MSLKENVEVIKEELSAEEQFFEKAVLTERVLKKYKNFIIAAVVIVVVGALAKVGLDIKEQNRIASANQALAKLMKNPKDAQSLKQLQDSSPKLYTLWNYSQAMKENNTQELATIAAKDFPIISDVASYHVSAAKKDTAALNNYALKQDTIYKDLALVDNGVIYLKKGDVKNAKAQFAQVPQNSRLMKNVTVLNHYGVK